MRKCDAKEGVSDPVKSDLVTLEYDPMCHVQDFVRSLLYSFGYYALRTAVVEFYCFIVHRESSF